MQKFLLFVFLSFVLQGNGQSHKKSTVISINTKKKDISQQKIYVDAGFKPYVKEYLDSMRHNHVKLFLLDNVDSIIRVDSNTVICGDSDALGCTTTNEVTNHRVIKIQFPKYYVDDSIGYYKALIFHEMGHAAMDLKHDYNGPSMMNEFLEDGYASWYMENWGVFVKQYCFLARSKEYCLKITASK